MYVHCQDCLFVCICVGAVNWQHVCILICNRTAVVTQHYSLAILFSILVKPRCTECNVGTTRTAYFAKLSSLTELTFFASFFPVFGGGLNVAVFCWLMHFGGHFKFKFVASRLFARYWAVCMLPPSPSPSPLPPSSLNQHSRRRRDISPWQVVFTGWLHWLCGLHFTAHLFICHFLTARRLLTWGPFLFFLPLPLSPVFNISRPVSSDRLANSRKTAAVAVAVIAYWLERVYLKNDIFCGLLNNNTNYYIPVTKYVPKGVTPLSAVPECLHVSLLFWVSKWPLFYAAFWM